VLGFIECPILRYRNLYDDSCEYSLKSHCKISVAYDFFVKKSRFIMGSF
jgi:hypothetical protein